MLAKLRRRTTNNPSTRLSHLLASNDPPSDAEDALVRSIIQALRGEIAALKLEANNYSFHPGWLTTREHREAAILENVNAHKSITSPLRKLPTQILQLILQKTYWDPPATLMLPWSFSQVCRLWRTVVHATPILWSHIIVDFNAKPTSPLSQKAKLKLILQRSANADLSISIRGFMVRDDHLSLLSILLAHSERWSFLDLIVNPESLAALQAVKGHLPRLSRLYLRFWNVSGIITLFNIAPRIEEVVIENSHSSRPPQVVFPLHNLRSYVVKTSPYSRPIAKVIDDVLSASSNLVHFETSCWHCIEDTLDPQQPRIALPRLEVLIIGFASRSGGDNPAELFFGRLILPSIMKIAVCNWAYGAVSAISSMLSRSLPCGLHTL
ncbi:hypothetical protein M413DRAFT_24678 [Hebeloma cylindrosporum]|uniref:Uncharacterized protein n=1 Tax=Hebeloma cylindrosporum TaxID=76867 RepID=A0A0C2Y6K1_HEBCY|nr:hypothetical protein M413DRAFT_24678 [Hebeloma cylindrosporum h7]